jgi:hypothetical protein
MFLEAFINPFSIESCFVSSVFPVAIKVTPSCQAEIVFWPMPPSVHFINGFVSPRINRQKFVMKIHIFKRISVGGTR